jgi:Nucleotidyl transferase AbiEii toxin, Type IV TA system
MTAPYRLATAAERAYYEGVLYPLQDRILAIAAEYGDDLVLTGGTALARAYLHHRYSDDIDLFTLRPQAGTLGRDFANALRAAGFTVEPVVESSSFVRMMAGDANGEAAIQVDIAPDAPRVEEAVRSQLGGVYVHTLRDLAANKIGAFENRSEVKDVVDLFHLARRFTWPEIFADAERKRVPIAYEDLQHFLATPVNGSALLSEPIAEADFDRFVTTLRAEVAAEIKKKLLECRAQVPKIASSLLWDTPRELRTINPRTKSVLARRAPTLPLPQRLALLEALA